MTPPPQLKQLQCSEGVTSSRLAEPEWSQLKIDFTENHLRCLAIVRRIITAQRVWITPPAPSTWQRPCHTIFFRTRQFFFFFTCPRKEQQMNPASLSLMVFWFQFPISSLSQFDKVTSRCHLQYPTPFTQAPWNAIINMKYCPDRLQLFQRGKHQCLLFRNQALAPGASHYLSSLGERKKQNSPTGITNPPLVCSAAAIQQNKIIPVAAYLGPEIKMINVKKYLFCWINTLIHSGRLHLF